MKMWEHDEIFWLKNWSCTDLCCRFLWTDVTAVRATQQSTNYIPDSNHWGLTARRLMEPVEYK